MSAAVATKSDFESPEEAKKARIAAKKAAALVKVESKHVAENLEDALLDGIRGKDGGDPTATVLGSDSIALKIRGVISTQCPTLDIAIGRGGIPLGRLSVLHGNNACGKTTLALHAAAECQRLGGVVIYLDKEYKLDPDYAVAIGVDTKKLIISQPHHLEDAFKVQTQAIAIAEKWRKATKTRVPVLVILDSMNAAITEAQFKGEMGDKFFAPQAGVYSQLLPKLIPEVSKADVALLWISQVRKKMNISFGDPDMIAGGEAPKFYASLIIRIKKVGSVKVGDDKTGDLLIAECIKNQIARPFRKGEYIINYGQGIDAHAAILDIAMEKKVIVRVKNTFFYGEKKLGTSEDKVKVNLRGAPKLCARIASECEIPWRAAGL